MFRGPIRHRKDDVCVQVPGIHPTQEWPETQAILSRSDTSITRLAGDRYVFVEFGDMVLEFGIRAKVAELEKWLHAHADHAGFVECSPGVRSVLLEYDAQKLPLKTFLDLLQRCVACHARCTCSVCVPVMSHCADGLAPPGNHGWEHSWRIAIRPVHWVTNVLLRGGPLASVNEGAHRTVFGGVAVTTWRL